MDFIREADFRRELKKSPAPGYLFFGDEDYLKAADIQAARQLICPDESLSVFNYISMDALDFSAERLEGALMAPPMLSDRKLIVVQGLDFTSMKPTDLDALLSVAAEAGSGDGNLLILSVAAGMLDPGYLPKKPSATLTKLATVLRPVYFERCTPAQLTAWAGRHYTAAGVEATPTIASATIARCGRDMFRLSAEIDKIAYYVLSHGRTQVTAEDVNFVGIADEEFDAFAFSGAILERRREDALRILADMKVRRVEPISALGEVIRVWCDLAAVKALMRENYTPAQIAAALKIHSYKAGLYVKQAVNIPDEAIRRAIDACVSADLSMKSASGQGFRPLELLICTL